MICINCGGASAIAAWRVGLHRAACLTAVPSGVAFLVSAAGLCACGILPVLGVTLEYVVSSVCGWSL